MPTAAGLRQAKQQDPQISTAMATSITEAIKQGTAQGLQQRASSEVSDYISRLSQSQGSHQFEDSTGERRLAYSPGSASQASLPGEETPHDLELSDDEGLEPDQPSFVGLFRPQVFRSLLFKAQTTTRLGCPLPLAEPVYTAVDPSTSLFVEPTVQRDTVPALKLFSDVVQRQWPFPNSGPLPNGKDKRLYNMTPDL